MRYLFLLILFALFGLCLRGQTQSTLEEGTISYITSQSVYIKFISTKNIAIGDTLFIKQGDKLLPAMKVNNLSSISCVCTPVPTFKFNISDVVFAKMKPKVKSPQEENKNINIVPPVEIISDSLDLDTDKKRCI